MTTPACTAGSIDHPDTKEITMATANWNGVVIAEADDADIVSRYLGLVGRDPS